MSGLENVETIDFLSISGSDAPGNCGIRGDPMVVYLALRSAEIFRVIKTGAFEFSRQNHRGRGHRTRKWPSARLINSRDPVKTAGMKGDFEGQIGHWKIRLRIR